MSSLFSQLTELRKVSNKPLPYRREYEGKVEVGFWNAQRQLHCSDGTRVQGLMVEKGSFQNGELHGIGSREHFSLSGITVERKEQGEFHHGVLQGLAHVEYIIRAENETGKTIQITGQFVDGQPWFGEGAWLDVKSNQWCIGRFHQGKLVGYAVIIDLEKNRFVSGTFSENELNGPFEEYYWRQTVNEPELEHKNSITVPSFLLQLLPLLPANVVIDIQIKGYAIQGHWDSKVHIVTSRFDALSYVGLGNTFDGTFLAGDLVHGQGLYPILGSDHWLGGTFELGQLSWGGFQLFARSLMTTADSHYVRRDAIFDQTRPLGLCLERSLDLCSSVSFPPQLVIYECLPVEQFTTRVVHYWVCLWLKAVQPMTMPDRFALIDMNSVHLPEWKVSPASSQTLYHYLMEADQDIPLSGSFSQGICSQGSHNETNHSFGLFQDWLKRAVLCTCEICIASKT